MKFIRKNNGFNATTFTGRKKGFIFKYLKSVDKWYCRVKHSKKDIIYNSLWDSISFEEENDIKEWCENFDYKKYSCLGDDV